jgi:hypothetical protein
MEVETRPQPGQGTAAGLVIALALAHFLLQPAREQGADGGPFLGSENASLLEEIGFNFQGDIRFCSLHACTYFRVARFYVLRLGNSSLVGPGWCVIPETTSRKGVNSSGIYASKLCIRNYASDGTGTLRQTVSQKYQSRLTSKF